MRVNRGREFTLNLSVFTQFGLSSTVLVTTFLIIVLNSVWSLRLVSDAIQAVDLNLPPSRFLSAPEAIKSLMPSIDDTVSKPEESSRMSSTQSWNDWSKMFEFGNNLRFKKCLVG